MALSNTKNTNYVIAFVAILMFAVSVVLTIAAGVAPGIALIWNVLAALYIGYDLIPQSMLASPLILIATLLDALVFALFAVFLATWFIDLVRSINITEYFALRKIRGLRRHVIVAPYNNFSKSLVEELTKSGSKFVVITDNQIQAARLNNANVLAIVGEFRSRDAFETAGIGSASYVVACDDDDVKNALITIAARDANPNVTVISRVIEEENMQKVSKAGASRIIIPSVTAGLSVGEEIVKRV